MKKNIYLFGIMVCLACVSCEKISYPELDFILKCTTLDATEVTETSAILSGTINMDLAEIDIEGTKTCGFFYDAGPHLYRNLSENVKANISSGKEFKKGSYFFCPLTISENKYA